MVKARSNDIVCQSLGHYYIFLVNYWFGWEMGHMIEVVMIVSKGRGGSL